VVVPRPATKAPRGGGPSTSQPGEDRAEGQTTL
jgi:hypothetical protein